MEIERKFLLNDEKFKLMDLSKYEKKYLSQSYLKTNGFEVRLRYVLNETIAKYFLTIKSEGNLQRKEYEIEIPKEKYELLLAKKLSNRASISKERYIIPLYNNLIAEVDIYKDLLNGLNVVEVEFNSIEDAKLFIVPEWFSTEITNDVNYKNKNLNKQENKKMKVQLANISNNPIEEIYKAYRICYAKGTQDEIVIPSEEKMIEFITPLILKGHYSPLEHVSFTFYINGVSRALMAQITRHRTAKFSIQSQRYIDGNNFEFVTPDSIIDAGLESEYREHMKAVMDMYNKLLENGVLKEDARFVLPNATTCNITMTVDLHNFRNFYGLRVCKDAQWEIRELAIEMMNQLKKIIPFADVDARRCGKACNKCNTI